MNKPSAPPKPPVVVTQKPLPVWGTAVIAASYLLLAVLVVIGLGLLVLGVSGASGAPQEASIAAFAASLFLAGYILVRSAEKLVRACCGVL